MELAKAFASCRPRGKAMDLQLVDKVAIVTGGSRGIGKAIGKALAREGADVALIGRDRAALDAAATEIAGQTKRTVKGFVANTGDDQSVKKAVAEILAAFNRIDILVNCAAQPAGQAKPPSLAEITAEALWAEVNVKVMGYLRMAQAVVEPMARQGGGRIINISGLAARATGSTIGSIRNISVAALTKTLADELAPKRISVVCVHPGLTRTEKTPQVVAWRAETLGVSAEEIEKRMAGGTLVGHLITAEEVADVVAFLASPKAVAINGDMIAAGGGVAGAIHY
jgi:NAD(P)-dependent dehydrogenase (short-subunit alcohol dehydrogenase family)